jgi:hypothetical protein
MASARRLAEALDGRTLRGLADMDAAVTADEQLTAALGHLRSLTALVARTDKPAADKFTAELAVIVREHGNAVADFIRKRIQELTEGR